MLLLLFGKLLLAAGNSVPLGSSGALARDAVSCSVGLAAPPSALASPAVSAMRSCVLLECKSERYVISLDDGKLLVMSSGTTECLPSGLRIAKLFLETGRLDAYCGIEVVRCATCSTTGIDAEDDCVGNVAGVGLVGLFGHVSRGER